MKSRGRLFLFLMLALVVGLWYLWPRLQSTVSLHNRSTQTITTLTITTEDESESFANLAPGEMRRTKLHLREKTRFAIKGVLEDKTVLEKQVTFITKEIGQNVVITVGLDGNIQVDVQAPKN
jgi:hypothetical protein